MYKRYVMEIFKDIKGYEGYYQVSNLGRVKSLERFDARGILHKEVMKSPHIGTNTYFNIRLCKNRVKKTILVHRLVAIAFIPNPHNKKTVNHKDGNKLNNLLGNLEWMTNSENSLHASRMGLLKTAAGEKQAHSKLKDNNVVDIKRMYIEGITQINISKIFNITPGNVSRIVNSKTWKHIS